MKCKITFILFSFLMVINVKSQDIKDFFDPVFPIEQALQQLAGPNQIGLLAPGEIAQAFQIGGITLSQQGALQMRDKVDQLEFAIADFNGVFGTPTITDVSSFQSFMNSHGGIQLSLQEATAIFNHFSGGGVAPGKNAHVFLMSLVAFRTKAIINFILNQAIDPKSPNSITKKTIDGVVQRIIKFMKIDFKPPVPSSGIGDWLENAYAEFSTSYTSFDDIASNGSGKEHSFTLTLGGNVAPDTNLSFSLSKSYSHRGGASSLTFESLAGDVVLHHNFNEYFGAGIYTFYADTDIHEVESHAWAYGGGLILSGNYSFEYFDISTVQTINKVWHEFGHDQIYVGAYSISRSWTDNFSTTLTASYTDSLKTDVDNDGDNSYWSMGGSVTWVIDENASISAGYERIVALQDFRSHTFNLSFRWYF